MDEDIQRIYSNLVPKVKIPVSPLCNSNFTPSSTFERDPYFTQLESSVFSRIAELIPEEPKETLPEYKDNGIQQISVEDAIKELIKMGEL